MWLIHLGLLCLCANFIDALELTEVEKETLEFEAPEYLKENFPYYLTGYDEDGLPIWIFELGRFDIRKYLEKGGETATNMSLYGDQMFLRFKVSGFNGTLGEKKGFVILMDMDNFSLSQAGHAGTIQFILSKFQRLSEYARSGDGAVRGGFSGSGYIINANFLFERIWDLGKTFLGEIANHIEIFGTNREKWQPRLLKRLPRESLPEAYGGPMEHKFVAVYG